MVGTTGSGRCPCSTPSDPTRTQLSIPVPANPGVRRTFCLGPVQFARTFVRGGKRSGNTGRLERSRCGGRRLRVFVNRHRWLPTNFGHRKEVLPVTQLRQLMIEELQRRNFAEHPSVPMFTVLNTSAVTSIAVRISWARSIFASTRRCCSPS